MDYPPYWYKLPRVKVIHMHVIIIDIVVTWLE